MADTRLIAEPGSPRMTVTREFDAPRDLVFRAFIDPDLIARWLGPRRLTTEIVEWDVRHGGAWRYISHDPSGATFGFRGVFHGTPSPDQITQTWEFEGYPGHPQLQEATFEEHDGRTTARLTVVCLSVEDRDGHIAAGMEGGMNEGFERLDELLPTMVAAG